MKDSNLSCRPQWTAKYAIQARVCYVALHAGTEVGNPVVRKWFEMTYRGASQMELSRGQEPYTVGRLMGEWWCHPGIGLLSPNHIILWVPVQQLQSLWQRVLSCRKNTFQWSMPAPSGNHYMWRVVRRAPKEVPSAVEMEATLILDDCSPDILCLVYLAHILIRDVKNTPLERLQHRITFLASSLSQTILFKTLLCWARQSQGSCFGPLSSNQC